MGRVGWPKIVLDIGRRFGLMGRMDAHAKLMFRSAPARPAARWGRRTRALVVRSAGFSLVPQKQGVFHFVAFREKGPTKWNAFCRFTLAIRPRKQAVPWNAKRQNASYFVT